MSIPGPIELFSFTAFRDTEHSTL